MKRNILINSRLIVVRGAEVERLRYLSVPKAGLTIKYMPVANVNV